MESAHASRSARSAAGDCGCDAAKSARADRVHRCAAEVARSPWDALALRAGPRLAVSQPDDSQELEAERMADAVLAPARTAAGPASAVATMAAPAARGVRRACAACDREAALQRRAGAGPVDWVDADAGRLLARLGPGRPLDPEVRAFFEPRFGRDFADVRVHDDAAAAASARALRAHAYALGAHLVFAAGRFDPSGPAGRRLLAHELAHVAQDGAPMLRRDDDASATPPAVDPDDPTTGPDADEDLAPDSLEGVQAEWDAMQDALQAAADQQGNDDYAAIDAEDRQGRPRRRDQLGFAFWMMTLPPAAYLRTIVVTDFWVERDADLVANLADVDAVDATFAKALDIATDEDRTIALLGPRADHYERDRPEAFPAFWREWLRRALEPDAREVDLTLKAAAAADEMARQGGRLQDGIFAQGLPVAFNDAMTMVSFTLVPELAREPVRHPVERFAQAALAWGYLQSLALFTKDWNRLAAGMVLAFGQGTLAFKLDELLDLKERQVSRLRDVDSLLHNGWMSAVDRKVFPPVPDGIAVRLGSYRFEAGFSAYDGLWLTPRGIFDAALRATDADIAHAGEEGRVAIGARWESVLGYRDAAWDAVKSGLWKQAPETVVTGGAFALAHAVAPEVMVFVDLFYAAKAAWDAGVEVPSEIEDALELVRSATTVVDLMRTQAQLSMTQVGGLTRQVLDAIAIRGAAKGARAHFSGAATEGLADAEGEASEALSTRLARTRERAAVLRETEDIVDRRLDDRQVAAEIEEAGQHAPHDSSEPGYDEQVDLPNKHQWRRRRGDGQWCRFSVPECYPGVEPENAGPVREAPVAPAAGPPPASPRSVPPEVEATRARADEAARAEAGARAALAAAEKEARQAQANLDYVLQERAKAGNRPTADRGAAIDLREQARARLQQARQAVDAAREAVELARREGARQALAGDRQLRAAQALEAAQRRFDEVAARNGHVRPPLATDEGRAWTDAERDLQASKQAFLDDVASTRRPLPELQAQLRAGSPPKTGTTARAAAVRSARASFEGSPSSSLSAGGRAVDVVTGRPLADADISPDHIVPIDRIFDEDGFNLLSFEQQKEILELPENYMPLTAEQNSSKGARSMAEWFQTEEGAKVPADRRQPLLDLEQRARERVRAEIAARLSRRGAAPPVAK